MTQQIATTYRVTLGSETRIVPQAEAMDVADAMVRAAGGGVPSIVAIEPEPVYSDWGATVVDESAKTRIEAQHAALNAAGVKVDTTEQFFATGTRMAKIGYETQSDRKADHDALPLVRDAADRLVQIVRAEKREDVEVDAADMARNVHVNNIMSLYGLRLSERALRGICARLESPSLGYLLGLRDRVAEELARPEPERDMNAVRADKATIAEVLTAELKRRPGTSFKLRTRKGMERDIYAAVSPSYAPADAPEALGRLIDAIPEDARGESSYDPGTTGWELRASVWTPTPVAEQAVGEAFRGYAAFSSKDNGTGRLSGGGGIELLRCLNASTYVADGTAANRTHRGRILDDVSAMVDAAIAAIDVLCGAWGTRRTASVDLPTGVPIEVAIPGFWRSLLTDRTSDLAGVLPGRTAQHVDGLTSAFWGERRETGFLSRADFAQGWTRYIQDQPNAVRREAEQAVGAWMVNDSRPLRYSAE